MTSEPARTVPSVVERTKAPSTCWTLVTAQGIRQLGLASDAAEMIATAARS
jgi:hypothetical protein